MIDAYTCTFRELDRVLKILVWNLKISRSESIEIGLETSSAVIQTINNNFSRALRIGYISFLIDVALKKTANW